MSPGVPSSKANTNSTITPIIEDDKRPARIPDLASLSLRLTADR